jgi:hypothetical protein
MEKENMSILNKIKKIFTKKDIIQDNKSESHKALLLEKEAATKAGKPWVAVLETHINKENLRNGFFELDWNNAFIEDLITAGYKGETNEEIVDGWFKEVTRNVLQEQGQDASRGAGYINVNKIGKDKSEIS